MYRLPLIIWKWPHNLLEVCGLKRTNKPIASLSEKIKIPLYINNLIVQTMDIFVISYEAKFALIPYALLHVQFTP